MSSRLERYLDEISKPLPEPQRSEWREEVRQHLEALIAAHQELGLSRDAATEVAIASFGEAQIIGKNVQRETNDLRFQPPHPVLDGAFRFLMAIFPGFLTLGVAAGFYAFDGGDEYLANIGRLADAFSLILPLFAGWVVGRKASPRHLRRDLLAAPLLGYIASLPMAMTFSCLHQPNWRPSPVEIALWLPYALGAAWLSYILCHSADNTVAPSA